MVALYSPSGLPPKPTFDLPPRRPVASSWLDELHDEYKCAGCGELKAHSEFTIGALENADTRPDRLQCPACRKAAEAKRDPLSKRISWKRGEIRRQQALAEKVRAKIALANEDGLHAMGARVALSGNQAELQRTEQQLMRHEAELAAMIEQRQQRDAVAA